MLRSPLSLLGSLILGCCLVALGLPEAQAQSRQGQQAPEQRQAVPPQNPAGTEVPSYAEPSNPSSSLGQPPGGANAPGGQAQTNSSAPGTPGDPAQTPLGGAEWLAAAGAAYALNRLRKEGDDEDEDDSDDEMP